MTNLFDSSEQALSDLSSLDDDMKAPEERLGSPAALRTAYESLRLADELSAANRSIIQGQMNFKPPHDDRELENKGQGDRFNITTGEGPAIKNEAVSAYVDIYTTPKVLAEIPLLPEVDKAQGLTWSAIMGEEFTTMDRDDQGSYAAHLQLADTFVTHGVAIPYFDDPETMNVSVAGLDHFKFPRQTGIVSSKVSFVCALGYYDVTALYKKIGGKGWNENVIKEACKKAGKASTQYNWEDPELMERDIKANEIFVDSVCKQIEVIHGWVTEFETGKISYYITTKDGSCDRGAKEEFLFKSPGYYASSDQAFQIFAFSVGDGGRLYTVRGLGYLIYQLCNAGDIMHCKALDNARVGSSLILQPSTVEDAQDMQLIDAGGFMMIPPTCKIPEQRFAQNLNNSLIPAIELNKQIINRATGGLAQGQQMLQPESDRRTKLEVSAQLDYINKLNSFAINLFYGPYDKIMREKVRRAFQVPQKDKEAARRVKEMKDRCMARGVPEAAFNLIDVKSVKATRIIGTGSRGSRIMLMEELGKGYATWDAVGRRNFDYDRAMMLGGVELADRYCGRPAEKRIPYDFKIAKLENFEMLEGDYVEPTDGEDHMVHLPVHIEELEVGLKGVDEGQIDLMEWTIEHQQLYRHCVATLEVTTVHELVQPELNMLTQRVQQIGELVVNGMKMINKAVRDGEMAGEQEEEANGEEERENRKVERDLRAKEMAHQQKLQQNMQLHLQKLQQLKETGEQKMVLGAQQAMSNLATSEAQERIKNMRAKQI